MARAYTEAQKRAAAKYDAANTVSIHLKLNKTTDADILEHLSKKQKQTYIKDLIRQDIAKGPVE